MKAGFVDYLTWWGPYVVGLLAVAYAAMGKLRSGDEERDDAGERPGWAAIIAVVVAVAIGKILIWVLATPADLRCAFAGAFAVGGMVVVFTLLWSRWRASSARGAEVFFAYGLTLLAFAVLRNYFRDAPVTYVFVASLGCWLGAAIVVYGGGRAPGVKAAAFMAALLAAGIALGVYHYPNTGIGSMLAVDMCALVLLLVMLGSLWNLSGRAGIVLRCAFGIAILVLTWWLGSLLGNAVLQDTRPGLCALIGAAAALLTGLLAWASRPNDQGHRVIGASEAGALAVLVAVAATAMCMRWLGGYGISLAAISGAVSAAFIMGSRECSWEERSHAMTAALATAAALAAVALVRVYLKTGAGSSEEMDLFASYTIPGLALGGTLALMLAAIGRPNGSGLAACLRGVCITLLGAAVVFAITYLWRGDATNGLVLGLAAGVFYALVSGFAHGRVDDDSALTPGLLILIATLAPPFLTATQNLSRAEKVHVLWWVIGVAAAIILAASTVRLIRVRAQGSTSP